MDELFSLTGQVAVVTGASRGIGEAIALRLAQAGAAVALVARKPEALAAVAGRIEASGGRALAIPAHTGKPEEVTAAVARAVAHFGQVDVLVNNAATNPYFGPLLDVEMAAWDKTFEVNLKGYFLAAREVIRHLEQRGAQGSIINIASIMGLRAAALQGVYGMTKAAVISMTQTLAQEVGSLGIRVNAIAPGLVETRFAKPLIDSPEIHDRVVGRAALPRHAQPDELAGAAVFLASRASSYMTGQVLVVDGGTINAV